MAKIGLNYPKDTSFAISAFDFNQIIEGIVRGERGIDTFGLALPKTTVAMEFLQLRDDGTQTIINGAAGPDTVNTILEQKFWNPVWSTDYAGMVPWTQSIGTKLSLKGKYGTAALVTKIDANHEVFGIGVLLELQTAESTLATKVSTFGHLTESTRDDLISAGLVMDATNIKTYNNTSVGGDASYTTVTTIPTFPFDFEMILTLSTESSLRVQIFIGGTSRFDVTLNPGAANVYPMLLTNTLSALVNTVELMEIV